MSNSTHGSTPDPTHKLMGWSGGNFSPIGDQWVAEYCWGFRPSKVLKTPLLRCNQMYYMCVMKDRRSLPSAKVASKDASSTCASDEGASKGH